MTREEAIRNIEEAISLNSEYIFIHEIYNDFESRTCENCKHSSIDYSGTLYQCHLLRISFNDDFGCNKWESK